MLSVLVSVKDEVSIKSSLSGSSHLLILVTLQHTHDLMEELFKHTPLLRSSLWCCCCSHQCFAWNKSASFFKSRLLYLHVSVCNQIKKQKKRVCTRQDRPSLAPSRAGPVQQASPKPPPLIQQSPSYSEQQTEAHREKTSKTLTTPQTPACMTACFFHYWAQTGALWVPVWACPY